MNNVENRDAENRRQVINFIPGPALMFVGNVMGPRPEDVPNFQVDSTPVLYVPENVQVFQLLEGKWVLLTEGVSSC